MRTVRGTALVLAALLATLSAQPAQSQLGGLIKKKAVEAAKGKAENKDEGAMTSSWKCDDCAPITSENMQALLRGLQAEAAARNEFDAMFAKAESSRVQTESKTKACRDAEAGGTTFQKMMIDGFSGANPPSTPEAVQKQMEKNKAAYAEYVDKKCGKDPSTSSARAASAYNERDAYAKAHAAGAKAAGMDMKAYDFLPDPTIAFCKLTKDQQQTAVEKGLRAGNTNKWLFTVDEAKAIQPHCNALMPALRSAGNNIA